MQFGPTKLDGTPSEGRIDVLTYKLIELGVHQLEQRYQIPRLWDEVKHDVCTLIQGGVPAKEVKLPDEVRKLLTLLGVHQ